MHHTTSTHKRHGVMNFPAPPFLRIVAVAVIALAPSYVLGQSTSAIEGAVTTVDAELGATESVRRKIWSEYLGLDEFTKALRGGKIDEETAEAMIARLQTLQVAPSKKKIDGTISALHQQLNGNGDADEQLSALQGHLRELGPRGSGWADVLAIDKLSSLLDDLDNATLDDTTQITAEDSEADDNSASEPIEARTELLSLLGHLEKEAQQIGQGREGGRGALRRALADWNASNEAPLTDALANEVRYSKRNYQPIDVTQLESSRNRVRQSLRTLDSFLNSGQADNAERWRNFLGWSTLNEQLNTASPRVRELGKSYQRFASGEKGLEMPAFRNARKDLLRYLEQLQLADANPRRLTEAQSDLSVAAEKLGRYLETASAKREAAWRKFLSLDNLEELIRDESRDIRQLNRVLTRFEADEDGLELRPFRDVANRLGKYMEVVISTRRGATAADRVANRLEEIARHLQTLADEPTPAAEADLRSDFAWLANTGQMPGLAGRIRGRFMQPNMRLKIQADVVARALSDGRSQTDPVAMCFYGSWVTGRTNSTVSYRGQLIPSPNQAVVDIVVGGGAQTLSVGRQRRISVYTQSDTGLWANKRLMFDGFTLTSLPTVAQASTQQRICKICVNRRIGRRLIRRIAMRRACKLQPCAEQLADTQGRNKLARQMDEQSVELIDKANAQLAELRARLRKQSLFPDALQVQSTRNAINMMATLRAGGEFLASSPAPELSTDSDAVVQIHESLINNLIASRVAGLKIDSESMAEQLESMNIEMPVPSDEDEDSLGDSNSDGGIEDGDADEEDEDEPWSMQFDQNAPVLIGFRNGKVTITVRGTKFTRGDQEIDNTIDISAAYEIVFTHGKGLGARRSGDVDINFVGVEGRLTTRQITYKTFLARKVKALFRERVSMADIPAGELKDQMESLPPKAIYSRDGWMTVGVDLEDALLKEAMGS